MKMQLPLDLLYKYWSNSATKPPCRGIPVILDTFMFRKQNTLWTRNCQEALLKKSVFGAWEMNSYTVYIISLSLAEDKLTIDLKCGADCKGSSQIDFRFNIVNIEL